MSKLPLSPNTIANIMWASGKGDPKVPPLEKVCNDFPTTTVMACLNMFAKKMEDTEDDIKGQEEKKIMLKIIKEIEKRYALKDTCMRSPTPELHRLLKEEK